jgi:BCCT family betaine/carnitine transporter
MKKIRNNNLLQSIDYSTTIIPLIGIVILSAIFMIRPEQSANLLSVLRNYLGNQLGSYYILVGFGTFICSLYIAFSKYGKIRLGKVSTPRYSNFTWGTMIFTSTMAADILYWSLIEWAYYAGEPHIKNMGGVQEWASTYPLFHWGPIPWGFYIILAAAFGFMLHVRGRNKQKFSEACRPILGSKVDGFWGKIIDLIAVFALLAGTATTFSMATPLLSASISKVFGLSPGIGLTIVILLLIAFVYTLTVLFGLKGISKLSNFCTYLFFGLLAYFLFLGGETIYIIETGITAVGKLIQNFVGMSTWLDPLRTSGDGVSGFAQNWTIFYWAYWMVWCVATPFFIGIISEGRTIRNTILGGYICGISGTFTSFIIFGNFGLAQYVKGRLDVVSQLAGGVDPSQVIISIFNKLPIANLALILLAVTMIAFYATTFDALTMVISTYSYKKLEVNKEPDKKIRVFWSVLFILLPIALIFSESSLNNLQTVSIIAAFPIGLIVLLIVMSFFKDARKYINESNYNEDLAEQDLLSKEYNEHSNTAQEVATTKYKER